MDAISSGFSPILPVVPKGNTPSAPDLDLPNATAAGEGGEAIALALDTREASPSGSTSEVATASQLEGVSQPGFDLSDFLADDAKTPSGPSSWGDARKAAESQWTPDKPIPGDEQRTVHADYSDVNQPLTDSQKAAYQAQVEANKGLEADALSKLSPKQQAAYQRVKDSLGDSPDAQVNVQLLLGEGKLTGKKDHTGKTLLDELDHVAQEPLAKSIDRKALLHDVIGEVAEPSRINQQNKATCMVTTVEIQLARENPAEYARLVGGLATPKGTVKVADGSTLQRDASTTTEDGSHRSLGTRLLTPSLANLELPKRAWKYDNKTDANMQVDVVMRTQSALSGKKNLEIRSDPMHTEEKLAKVQELVKKGYAVSVGMEFAIPGPTGRIDEMHQILVTGMKEGRVQYTNPWGTEESMSMKDFSDRFLGTSGSAVKF